MLVCSTPRFYQANADAVHSVQQRKRPNSARCLATRWRKISVQPRGNKPSSIASRASGPSQDSPVKSAQQLGLWTAIDAAATLGSVAGALAFIITSEALLVGIPVVLPLVAWYAGRQKENLQIEVGSPIHQLAHGRPYIVCWCTRCQQMLSKDQGAHSQRHS